MDLAQIFYLVAVVAFTLTAAVTDYRTRKLPNWLTVPACLVGLVFHVVLGGVHGGFAGAGQGALFSLAGFGVGFGILLLLWLIGSGGAGDVKMMGALGAWLGWKTTLIVFLVSTVFVMLGSFGVLTAEFFARGMSYTRRRYLAAADTSGDRGAKYKLRSEEAQRAQKLRRRLMPYGVPVALATWAVLAWVNLA